MAAPSGFRWKGPSIPRAKPISSEQWDEHKVEICRLYECTTVEELMKEMEDKHDFKPSRRQYISQFQKWGLQKYNTMNSKSRISTTSNSSSAILLQGLGTSISQNELTSTDASKRPLSVRTRCSTQSQPKGPAVPKKKQKLEEHLAHRRDPYADLALTFDNSERGKIASAETYRLPPTGPQTTILAPKPDVLPKQKQNIDDYLSHQNLPYTQLALVSEDTEMRDLHSLEAYQSPDRSLQDGSLNEMESFIFNNSNGGFSTPYASNTASYTEDGSEGSVEGFDEPFENLNALRSTPIEFIPGLQSIERPERLVPEPERVEDEASRNVSWDAIRRDGQATCDWDDNYAISSFETSSSPIEHDHTGSQFSLPLRWGSVDELARLAREIDLDRPIDLFSENEIADMRKAADYLKLLHFQEEAAHLYILLVKRYQVDGDRQHGVIIALIIELTYTASSPTHCEIARNLLRKELQNDPSPLAMFLVNMMLAHSYVRYEQYYQTAQHLEAAQHWRNEQDIITQLPANDRSFDLIAYQCVTRCMSLPDGFCPDADMESVFFVPYGEMSGIELPDFQERILYRIPGPFEITDGRMGHTCIRSCLQWCKNELKHATSLPGVWKSMKSTSISRTSAEKRATFIFLWNRSQNSQSKLSDLSMSTWIMESESRMGLSPSQLLHMVGRMIPAGYKWKPSKSSAKLVKANRRLYDVLLSLSDTELAACLLKCFLTNTSFTHWPPEAWTLQNASRFQTFGVLRKALMLILPNLKSADRDSGDGTITPRQVFGAILPTLAPSLSTSSLRGMKGQMQTSISSRARDARHSVAVGNTSVSRLSEMLANSLNLSDRPRTSMSMQSQVDTFSSSIRELLGTAENAFHSRQSRVY